MKCPNCNATLIYNPTTRLLECESCDSTFEADSFSVSKRSWAEEHVQPPDNAVPSQGPVTCASYICTSCGAELVGTYDTSAIGFCSYCGGENIIASRMAVQRPDRIIPFSRSKESCKQKYMDTVRKMPFVPGELKDERYVDAIRGIYVPYSIHHATHNGRIDAEYTLHDASYNYKYGLHGYVASDCNVPIDASVQLDDYIGSTVFPYDRQQEVPFHEGYLSSYYIELPDTDDSQYYRAVAEQVLGFECELATAPYAPDDVKDLRTPETEQTVFVGKDTVLSPLYFLTYRNKDKVCYTVLPGTEGNSSIYAEIPVDIRKYMMVLMALAAAIWGALSFLPIFPTFDHGTVLAIMAVFAVIALFLHESEYGKQLEKDSYLIGSKKKKAMPVVFLAVGFFALLFFHLPLIFLIAAAAIYSYVQILSDKKADRAIDIMHSHILFGASMAMVLLSLANMMMTIPDEAMYAMMAAAFLASLFGFYSLIKVFNRSCERERPHFTRQGGHNEIHDL